MDPITFASLFFGGTLFHIYHAWGKVSNQIPTAPTKRNLKDKSTIVIKKNYPQSVKTDGVKKSTGNRRTTYDGITDGLLNNYGMPGDKTISRSLSPHYVFYGNDIKFKFIFKKNGKAFFKSPEYILDIDSDSNNSIETALVKTLQKPYLIDNTEIKLKYNYINNVNKKNIQLKIYKNNMNSKIGETHKLTAPAETITIVPQGDNNNIDTIYLEFVRI
jgi:hypothetical protein